MTYSFNYGILTNWFHILAVVRLLVVAWQPPWGWIGTLTLQRFEVDHPLMGLISGVVCFPGQHLAVDWG